MIRAAVTGEFGARRECGSPPAAAEENEEKAENAEQSGRRFGDLLESAGDVALRRAGGQARTEPDENTRKEGGQALAGRDQNGG